MKNKKHLILFCIPLIIAVMVLPLCSFTTVSVATDGIDSGFETYSSVANACVDYNYYYGTSSIYHGRLNQCARFLSNATSSVDLGLLNRSIKYTACDYYITSSSRIIIDANESGVSQVGDNQPRVSMFYRTNDNTRVQFPISCYVETLNEFDNLQYGYYHGNQDVGYTLFDLSDYDITIDLDFTYIYVKSNGLPDDGSLAHYRERIRMNSLPAAGEAGVGWFFAPYDYAEFALMEYFPQEFWLDPDFVYGYVSNFYANITVTKKEGDAVASTNLCNAVRVTSNYINTTDETYSLYVTHLPQILDSVNPPFNNGYEYGYNRGVSNAPNVWGSFTRFLTTTIGGFLDMNITPTITISSMLGIILSVTLVVAFLKIFAGG